MKGYFSRIYKRKCSTRQLSIVLQLSLQEELQAPIMFFQVNITIYLFGKFTESNIMFVFQIIVCSTLVAFSCGAPQHHATSYVSTNVAGHGGEGGEDGGLGSHYVQHSAPITYIKHVPIIVKQEEKYEEKHNEEDHVSSTYFNYKFV